MLSEPLSAFGSLCKAAARDGFDRLDDRDDLWQVLARITSRKVADQVNRRRRLRRGGGRVVGEGALDPTGGDDRGGLGSDLQALSRANAAASAAMAAYNQDLAAARSDAGAAQADAADMQARFGPFLAQVRAQAAQIPNIRVVDVIFIPKGMNDIASRTADFLNSTVNNFHNTFGPDLNDMMNRLVDYAEPEVDALDQVDAALGAYESLLG